MILFLIAPFQGRGGGYMHPFSFEFWVVHICCYQNLYEKIVVLLFIFFFLPYFPEEDIYFWVPGYIFFFLCCFFLLWLPVFLLVLKKLSDGDILLAHFLPLLSLTRDWRVPDFNRAGLECVRQTIWVVYLGRECEGGSSMLYNVYYLLYLKCKILTSLITCSFPPKTLCMQSFMGITHVDVHNLHTVGGL